MTKLGVATTKKVEGYDQLGRCNQRHVGVYDQHWELTVMIRFCTIRCEGDREECTRSQDETKITVEDQLNQIAGEKEIGDYATNRKHFEI